MNIFTTKIGKTLSIALVSLAAATSIATTTAPAQAAQSSPSASKPAQGKVVTYSIVRHYGADSVMANRFQTRWDVTQVVDAATNKPLSLKAITQIYCEVYPSNLGWTGKPSCTYKRMPGGWIITNVAVFNSPRACIGETCTPSMTMTLGSRIYLNRVGSIVREEPIGDSA